MSPDNTSQTNAHLERAQMVFNQFEEKIQSIINSKSDFIKPFNELSSVEKVLKNASNYEYEHRSIPRLLEHASINYRVPNGTPEYFTELLNLAESKAGVTYLECPVYISFHEAIINKIGDSDYILDDNFNTLISKYPELSKRKNQEIKKLKAERSEQIRKEKEEEKREKTIATMSDKIDNLDFTGVDVNRMFFEVSKLFNYIGEYEILGMEKSKKRYVISKMIIPQDNENLVLFAQNLAQYINSNWGSVYGDNGKNLFADTVVKVRQMLKERKLWDRKKYKYLTEYNHLEFDEIEERNAKLQKIALIAGGVIAFILFLIIIF